VLLLPDDVDDADEQRLISWMSADEANAVLRTSTSTAVNRSHLRAGAV
jgi:hypothetical protein